MDGVICIIGGFALLVFFLWIGLCSHIHNEAESIRKSIEKRSEK